ncbi:hypothetical protein EV645_7183, partial [Kribbella rubisoli]
MEFRGKHAVRRAIAQLIAEGVIARGDGNQYGLQPERISVSYAGGGDSAPVFVHSPHISDTSSTPRFLLVGPEAAGDTESLLPAEEMLTGLDRVLGTRGLQLMRESRRALQRGLYLASSTLLAAASEAAWFNLARSIADPGEKLLRLVDDGWDLAEVIRLTEQHLLALKRTRTLVTEITSQGHLFRDIRNYALHPVEEHDQDREVWLSETGATLLSISARRYFIKMAAVQEALSPRAHPATVAWRPSAVTSLSVKAQPGLGSLCPPTADCRSEVASCRRRVKTDPLATAGSGPLRDPVKGDDSGGLG